MEYARNWQTLQSINKIVQERLILNGFTKPTDVQTQVIKAYKNNKDFIVASQTVVLLGSGKTLAFGIPIISEMLNNIDHHKDKGTNNQISCLILTPTRELAVQIMKHLKPLIDKDVKNLNFQFINQLYIGCLIGGMSKQKQIRILNQKLNILIATPGRLWEFIEKEIVDSLKNLNTLDYLIIDEADRMVELGHYEDLDKIIDKISMPTNEYYDKEVGDLLRKKSQKFCFSNLNQQQMYDMEPDQLIEMDFNEFQKMQLGEKIGDQEQQDENVEEEEDDEGDDEQQNQEASYNDDQEQEKSDGQEQDGDEEDDDDEQNDQYDEQQDEYNQENDKHDQINTNMKIFLVSATLTHQFIKGSKFKFFKKEKGQDKNKDAQDMVPKLQSLIGKLKIQKPKMIDLTQSFIFPQELKIYHAYVEEDDKLLFVVNYINQKKDQTFIIFSNSITYAKKINSLLDVLDIKCLCLHSLQQQRQRLKRLDQFQSKVIKVLICTDVAARGLDIPNVQNVIHFQIPFTVDTFVHRCGRTARIGNEGTTLCLIGPKDVIRFHKLESDIIKSGVEMAAYNISYQERENLNQIIKQAQELEKHKHQLTKKSKHKDGLQMQLKNKEFDLDEQDIRREIEMVDEEIIVKKKMLDQKAQQYQTILAQRQQPNQRQYNRDRRNALFLTPEQIRNLQSKMSEVGQQIQQNKTQNNSKKNKLKQKRARKINKMG